MPEPDLHTCSILSIGNELLLGLTVDTNATWLCGEMQQIGWQVTSVRTVGDRIGDIVKALNDTDTPLVLVTGGLGPTDDDKTRHALAAACSVKLQEQPDLVRDIEARFARIHKPMGESNRIQACIPEHAQALRNSCGTAPGIHCRLEKRDIFAMPGVPREMKAMFRESVLPTIPTDSICTVMRRLKLHGIGESSVGEVVRAWMGENDNPIIGTTVENGLITIRLIAQAKDKSTATHMCARVESEISEKLASHIYGYDDDTLPGVVVRLLAEQDMTLALAESCTGGMIAGDIVGVPGASDVLLEGIVCYADDAKVRRLGVPSSMIEKHGAVSREVAVALATGACRESGATCGIGVTGVAGPGGGTEEKPVGTVWLALATPSGIWYTQQSFAHDRTGNRRRATNMSLDLLRRILLGLEYPWEVGFEQR